VKRRQENAIGLFAGVKLKKNPISIEGDVEK
jgi:hypothetical protein